MTLAYHLLATIQRRLRGKGQLSYRWQTRRALLAIQMRVTVAMTNDQGERLASRQTTENPSSWKSTGP